MSGFRVVLDACALFPIARADLLLRLAEQGLYVPLWSSRIMVELNRALLRNERATASRAVRRWVCMTEAFPDALVDNWESLADGIIGIPDEDDRHVVAAAIEGRASVIVTDNIRDFPDLAFNPHGLHAVKTDDFLLDLFDIAPGVVMKCLDAMVASRSRPPVSFEKLLADIAKSAPEFSKTVTNYKDNNS